MQEKDVVKAETQKLIEIRNAFYEYLDANIPKDEMEQYDFAAAPALDAKSVYEHFFKLDYQARKLRAFLVQDYDLHAE